MGLEAGGTTTHFSWEVFWVVEGLEDELSWSVLLAFDFVFDFFFFVFEEVVVEVEGVKDDMIGDVCE